MSARSLQGWKEIADYLGRGVRTVQRWEASFGLPVRRPAGRDRTAVFALPEELDKWMTSAPGARAIASNGSFNYRILLVDDEKSIRETAKAVLESRGYDVQVAEDGFDALAHLKNAVPDIIITDLRMPNMSGFELLCVVRKRFPQIGVIAVSGEFIPASADAFLADAFIEKGDPPNDLLAKILDLLEQAPIRPSQKKYERAAVWMTRAKKDYVVVTCPYCLRTLPTPQPHGDEVQRVECSYCSQTITFRMIPTTASL